MDDIKERILEFVAVGKMKGGLKGKILCLVGPPGKELFLSVRGRKNQFKLIDCEVNELLVKIRSLNRKFARISLGGEGDASFLKGHRKTYIGAYPGKIISALRDCGTENCVILLDEIDKLGKSTVITNRKLPASRRPPRKPT